jgi:RNA polymerase sigma-70 factor, ECF subfamily
MTTVAVTPAQSPLPHAERAPLDRALVQAVAHGDELALDELYSHYASAVYNFALRLVNERETAEDITQEVFLSVWRGAWRYRGECSVQTWLLRTAHHKAVDWLRRQRPAVSLDEVFELPDPRSTDAFELSDTTAQIRQALASLSVNHRAVVELTFVNGLSYREIAAVMVCPTGTVKSRMSYALAHLRRTLSLQDVSVETVSGALTQCVAGAERRTRRGETGLRG